MRGTGQDSNHEQHHDTAVPVNRGIHETDPQIEEGKNSFCICVICGLKSVNP